jgi:c-di-GMP-binding flagellar brake protein YcgR
MEQRKQYRVEMDPSTDLHVDIVLPDGTPVPGAPVDLSADGAGIRFLSLRFAGPPCPAHGIGDEVQLRFTSKLLKQPLLVKARVAHRVEEDGCRRYGFQFTNRSELERQLAPELFRLFNRRSAYRVTPNERAPIDVIMEDHQGGAPVHARAVDISASGLGVRAPIEAEGTFVSIDHIGMTISLPGRPQPVVLRGIIRNRRLAGHEIRYGIEFDFERSRNTKREQHAVAEYVMIRQREMLRNIKAA